MNNLNDLRVDEFTSPCPVSVNLNTVVEEIVKIMNENDFRHIPVMNGKKIAGIISQRDIINLMGQRYSSEIKAQDIMTEKPYCVLESTPISEVAFTMSENKIGCALVLDESQNLSGIFTTTDALNALIEVVRGDV